jgi:hypothetical protein
MNNRLNKPVTWRDILDIISAFGSAFIVLLAIAKGYYGVIGALVAIFVWNYSTTERRLKKLEHELKILKEVDDIKP